MLPKRAETVTALASGPEDTREHEEHPDRVPKAAHAAILSGGRATSSGIRRRRIKPSRDANTSSTHVARWAVASARERPVGVTCCFSIRRDTPPCGLDVPSALPENLVYGSPDGWLGATCADDRGERGARDWRGKHVE